MKKNRSVKLGMAVIAVAAALFIIAAGIAVPILCRGLYYKSIPALSIKTGYSEQVIRTAYDEVMDYLVKGAPFATGALQYSMDGQSHFVDCKALFDLDFTVAAVTGAMLFFMLFVGILRKRRGLAGFSARHLPVFWSAVCSGAFFFAVGIWGAADFDTLFVTFHRVFFPGKTNWVFDPAYDEIINILPEDYFLLCGGVIAAIIVTANIGCIAADTLWRKKQTSHK